MEFKDKFIAFIDILGFKGLVQDAEAGIGLSLAKINSLLKLLGSSADRKKYEQYGAPICPMSQRTGADVDFRLTQISDCAIVSTEISPAGAINLIGHCWGSVIELMQLGIMCRGYITRGLIYHTDDQVLGTGYQNALSAEPQVSVFKRNADERGTPFVELDSAVCSYIEVSGDECVKEMFRRMTGSDGDGVALYPFKRLSHSFVIDHTFNPAKEKKANDNLRQTLKTVKERVQSFIDTSNPSAVRKAEHYLRALDEQLVVCNTTDETIDLLCKPFSASSLFP